MINLVTGAPGAGKTLFTLFYVEQLARKEGRQVYYSGISDLRIPGWIELEDPATWFDCPPGSIIIIDECQRLFRPRSYSSAVPAYVSRLETHRHAGHDLFLITQHPMLVDSNVRRLIGGPGAHRHVVRTFGMQRCTVHEWAQINEQPDKRREGSVRHEVSYPKEVFSWYKSAEVHTVKARIPMRIWFLLATPVLLAAAGWMVWAGLSRYGDPGGFKEQQQPAQLTRSNMPPPVAARPAGPAPFDPHAWFRARVPRVPDLAYTAPVYDELTRPVDPPLPAMCMHSGPRCQCYTQQAVRVAVSDSVCRQIVRDGMHVDWRPAWSEGRPPEPVAVGVPAGS